MAKNTASTGTAKITEITAKVTGLLTPLESADRQRVIRASLTLLGEDLGTLDTHTDDGANAGVGAGGAQTFNAKVTAWMKANKITAAQLQQVFDGAEVIDLSIPGGSAKEKTINTYVIVGIATFLSTGNANIDDKKARDLCEKVGCFSSGNHSLYMQSKGNVMSGTKASGWKLTGPGFIKGAELIKGMTKG